MKPLFILLTAISSFFAKNSTASEGVTPSVLHAFKNTFTDVKEVTWSVRKDFYKATFVLNGQHITAFYDAQGELLATTKNLTSLELPVLLQTSLKKKYTNYWITELFELTNDEGAAYYIKLESADDKIVLKDVDGTHWTVFSKDHK